MRDNKRVSRHITVFLVGAAIVGYGVWLVWPPLVFIVGGGTLMALAAGAYGRLQEATKERSL